MENCQKIGGAESEADAGDIFLCDLKRIEANDLAAGIEKRAAGVAGIDGGVGLNPGAGAEGRKFSNCADDTLGGAEEHGIAGIADSEYGFALLNRSDVGKNEIREGVAWRVGGSAFTRAMSRSASM